MASNKYNTSIDMWSIGCILYEMLCKRVLFAGNSEGGQLIEMEQLLGAPPDSAMESLITKYGLDKEIIKLFKRVINFENTKRIDLFYILKHYNEFNKKLSYDDVDLRDAAKFIEDCCQWNPDDRLSAEDSLTHPFLKDI